MTKELVSLQRPVVVPARQSVLGSWPAAFLAPVPVHAFLTYGEQCLIRTHRHWLVPCKRIAQAAVGMPVAFLLSIIAPGVWWLQAILWLSAMTHQGYLAYCVLLWRNDQIIVTDRRLLRVYGVFTTTVEDRTLSLITDRALHQSFWGRVLGYGTLRVESGGRHDDGAARELIEFVPNPKLIYRALA